MASKKNKKMSVEIKPNIIRKTDRCVKQCEQVEESGPGKTTMTTTSSNLAKRDGNKSAKVAKGGLKMTKNRYDEMYRLLMIWIKDKKITVDESAERTIRDKAKDIYDDLQKNFPELAMKATGEYKGPFKPSKSWYLQFKNKFDISAKMRREVLSAAKKAAEQFPVDFQQFLTDEEYRPEQVFNAAETELFWKRMPNRTFITKEEMKMRGHKPMKDKLTLLFAANASGDLKIKPMLVYHSENPGVFKKRSVVKSKLPVHWGSIYTSFLSQVSFKEWTLKTFAPAVKKYLLDKELPLKALLVLDDSSSHPRFLEEMLKKEHFPFIKVKYLPPHTSTILQPMDQNIIANFKKLYTRALFHKVIEECEYCGDITVRTFWREKFDILTGIRLIEKAWGEVSQGILNSAWTKLVPNWTQGEANEDPEVMKDIITATRTLGLEVEEKDVEALIEEHKEELTAVELQALLDYQHNEALREASSDDDEKRTEEDQELAIEDLHALLDQQYDESQREMLSDKYEKRTNQPISAAAIKDILDKWGEVQEFTNTHYPNYAEANTINDLYDDTLAHYFRQALKKRKKETTLEDSDNPDFFCKEPPAKKQRTDDDDDEDDDDLTLQEIRDNLNA